MDYLTAFDISASGMSVEKARLETVALNLANVNSTRGADGSLYKPQKVISAARTSVEFDKQISLIENRASAAGVSIVEVRELEIAPRMVYEPGHPQADEKGFVAYPNINPASEMISLMEAVRAYEANVHALNASKSMAIRALEIGGK